MTFRRRTVLLAAAAVAVAVVLVSVVVYVTTRDELLGQLDSSLRQKVTPGEAQSVEIKLSGVSPKRLATLEKEGKRLPAPTTLSMNQIQSGATRRRGKVIEPEATGGKQVEGGKGSGSGGLIPGNVSIGKNGNAGFARLILPDGGLGGATGSAQWIQADGKVLRSPGKGSLLPVTDATREVAAGKRGSYFSDETVAGAKARVLTAQEPNGGVLQVALPLGEVEGALAHLRLVLLIVSLGGIALAAALGLLVSRAALVPVRRLTGAAERVARTQDLGHRIEPGGDDELGRLAASFNTMLATLERSQLGQRQLVSDASHELRTPLTSIGANLDALAIGDDLDPAERARVVAAAQAQLRELGVLVGDLVDLSKTEVDEIEVEDVRLDLAAAGAIQRAGLHAPDTHFLLDAEPCLVSASPARLERAIANMLDNAVKWGPPGGPVEVRVGEGRLEVRDHGPGIAPADLPRVFDRFYRAASARALPGSGLGVAIVRLVAEPHGGSVEAANDPGGGARLTLELPTLAMTAAESAAALAGPADSATLQQAPRLL